MSHDFYAEYRQLLISLEKSHIEDLSSQQVNHFISGIDVAQYWLNQVIHERQKNNIETTEYKELLERLTAFSPRLESIVQSKIDEELIQSVCASAKPVHLFLSVDADEKLKAKLIFPNCGHVGEVDLLKMYEKSSEYRAWLRSLESVLDGRLDHLKFGVACPKCGKTSVEVQLFIDPKKVIQLARSGKIQVR